MFILVFVCHIFFVLLCRSGSYEVGSEGDSGNPLLDPSSSDTPTKTNLNSKRENEEDHLTDNYRYRIQFIRNEAGI